MPLTLKLSNNQNNDTLKILNSNSISNTINDISTININNILTDSIIGVSSLNSLYMGPTNQMIYSGMSLNNFTFKFSLSDFETNFTTNLICMDICYDDFNNSHIDINDYSSNTCDNYIYCNATNSSCTINCIDEYSCDNKTIFSNNENTIINCNGLKSCRNLS